MSLITWVPSIVKSNAVEHTALVPNDDSIVKNKINNATKNIASKIFSTKLTFFAQPGDAKYSNENSHIKKLEYFILIRRFSVNWTFKLRQKRHFLNRKKQNIFLPMKLMAWFLPNVTKARILIHFFVQNYSNFHATETIKEDQEPTTNTGNKFDLIKSS